MLRGYQPRQPEVDGLAYHEGLNAVGIGGGVAGNVIPDECVVSVNYRFAPDRSADEAADHVHEVFAGFDVQVTDVAPGARPGAPGARPGAPTGQPVGWRSGRGRPPPNPGPPPAPPDWRKRHH